ncbi:MAG: folate family ECF transporter S component [Bacillota bacterium]|nr:folate family ECF transporter S component [Bacillota bacterium]
MSKKQFPGQFPDQNDQKAIPKITRIPYLKVFELNPTFKLSLAAMLLATSVVLGTFATIATPYLKIGFRFLPIAIAGIILGPIYGAVIGGLTDILCFFTNNPTGEPYFPGFTISLIIVGLVYGLVFYKKDVTILKLVITKIGLDIFIEILLKSFWINIAYGAPFVVILPTFIIESAIMLPIEVTLIYAVTLLTAKIPIKAHN